MTKMAVCYYRVSTTKQGISGLGLEAQRHVAREYCRANGLEIIEEFEEVQSGGKNDREKMKDALLRCELTKSKLVVAKLDRISRDVGFIDALLKSGVSFVCADMPEANESMIQFMSVFAQYERKMASERTKAALARKKAQGVKLGNPNMKAMRANIPENAREMGTEAIKHRADTFSKKLLPEINKAKAEGCNSLEQIAEWLNQKHIKTARGAEFRATTVKRILERLSC